MFISNIIRENILIFKDGNRFLDSNNSEMFQISHGSDLFHR